MKLGGHPSPLRCNKNKRFTGHLLCARLCSKYFVHSYSLNPINNTVKQILSSLPYRKESAGTGGSCPNHKAVMMKLRCWLGDQAPLPHLITPAAQGPQDPGSSLDAGKDGEPAQIPAQLFSSSLNLLSSSLPDLISFLVGQQALLSSCTPSETIVQGINLELLVFKQSRI